MKFYVIIEIDIFINDVFSFLDRAVVRMNRTALIFIDTEVLLVCTFVFHIIFMINNNRYPEQYSLTEIYEGKQFVSCRHSQNTILKYYSDKLHSLRG
jgi:hypothetical protein